MKTILILVLMLSPLFFLPLGAQSISNHGYPEHFVAGTLIGGTVSYLTFKKTDNKLTSWLVGFAAATGAGFLKECIDPVLLNRTRNWKDFEYTVYGGALGASIVIPLNRRK